MSNTSINTLPKDKETPANIISTPNPSSIDEAVDGFNKRLLEELPPSINETLFGDAIRLIRNILVSSNQIQPSKIINFLEEKRKQELQKENFKDAA